MNLRLAPNVKSTYIQVYISGFSTVALGDWEYFCPPMGCQSVAGLPHSIKFAGTHSYTWVKRGTVKVKCLAQENNSMSPAMARTQAARSGDERTNDEATTPPSLNVARVIYLTNDVSFSCVCLVTDHEFGHNIVKALWIRRLL